MDDEQLLTSHQGALPENVLSIAREFWAGFAAVDRIDVVYVGTLPKIG